MLSLSSRVRSRKAKMRMSRSFWDKVVMQPKSDTRYLQCFHLHAFSRSVLDWSWIKRKMTETRVRNIYLTTPHRPHVKRFGLFSKLNELCSFSWLLNKAHAKGFSLRTIVPASISIFAISPLPFPSTLPNLYKVSPFHDPLIESAITNLRLLVSASERPDLQFHASIGTRFHAGLVQ